MRLFKVLVETVALGDELPQRRRLARIVSHIEKVTYVLLPLPEADLLRLDLLREALAECLLLFLELRIVDLLDLRLAELARLHLLLPVVLVVELLCGRDQVKHVCADEQRAELAEVAVRVVLDCVGRIRRRTVRRNEWTYLLQRPTCTRDP